LGLSFFANEAGGQLTDTNTSVEISRITNAAASEEWFFNIAYIEESDGRFSICDVDFKDGVYKNGVLLKWKGVRIPREYLPRFVAERGLVSVSITSHIYYRGTGIPKLSPDVCCFYGSAPFPVKEVDPPMFYGMVGKNLFIGFFHQGNGYVIGKIEKPRLKTKLKLLGWRAPYRFVEVPPHRKDELKKLLSELMEDTPNLVNGKK